ncbi:hypothetical protein B0H14DRAFT_2659441 [Mycena olivaceomarginata]|nr:hypothetical protein B0H14DRAFT_2659441 [Mycena olivaceomarginata]
MESPSTLDPLDEESWIFSAAIRLCTLKHSRRVYRSRGREYSRVKREDVIHRRSTTSTPTMLRLRGRISSSPLTCYTKPPAKTAAFNLAAAFSLRPVHHPLDRRWGLRLAAEEKNISDIGSVEPPSPPPPPFSNTKSGGRLPGIGGMGMGCGTKGRTSDSATPPTSSLVAFSTTAAVGDSTSRRWSMDGVGEVGEWERARSRQRTGRALADSWRRTRREDVFCVFVRVDGDGAGCVWEEQQRSFTYQGRLECDFVFFLETEQYLLQTHPPPLFSPPNAARARAAHAPALMVPRRPTAPFAVHRMALAGKAAGKDVGMLFGPSAAAGALSLPGILAALPPSSFSLRLFFLRPFIATSPHLSRPYIAYFSHPSALIFIPISCVLLRSALFARLGAGVFSSVNPKHTRERLIPPYLSNSTK